MNDSPPPRPLAWMRRILDNADGIFVRAQVNGRWTNVALRELSPTEQAEHVKRWVSEERGAP